MSKALLPSRVQTEKLYRRGWGILEGVAKIAEDTELKPQDRLAAARLFFSVLEMVPGAHPRGVVPSNDQRIVATQVNVDVTVDKSPSRRQNDKGGKRFEPIGAPPNPDNRLMVDTEGKLLSADVEV
jgi:hypothetical protein